MDEIDRENKEHYQQIIKVFDGKNTFLDKDSQKGIQNDLLELLSVKTAKLKKEICEKFKTVYEELTRTEQTALQKLEEIKQIITQNLLLSLHPEEKTILAYDFWEASALEIIKESEEPSSEGHLEFFKKKDVILEEGRDILRKLKGSQEAAYSHVVERIEDFNVLCHEISCESIFGSMVEITEHS